MDSFHPVDGRPSSSGLDKERVARARLLGPFALTDLSGVDLAPGGRKVQAVLAYLILAAGRPVPRHELAAFAWADRAAEQARASLRQALHEARRLIERELLVIGRDYALIDASRVETDIGRILDFARSGRLGDLALELSPWRGALLSNFDGIDPHVDRWLAAERLRCAEEIHAEVSACVSQALESGTSDDCRPIAAFLTDLKPLDETASRMAMSCCAACKDHGGVEREFERLKAALRREAGEAPSARTTALYERLTSDDLGVAAVERTRAAAAPDAPAGVRPLGVRWRWLILAASLAVVAALGLLARYRFGQAGRDQVLLVEPLQAAPSDRPAQIVRSGLSGDLARVMVGKPADLSVAASGGREPKHRHAQLSVAGDAATTGNVLHVHLQLRDIKTGSILWSQNFAAPPADAEALGERVATKVGSVLDCALSTRHRGAAAVGDEATIRYLKACDLISDYDLGGVLDLLRQVTVLAPGFARAWADVGVTEAMTAPSLPPPQRAMAYAEAKKNALRALQIDPRTGLAYYALANAQPGIANWPQRMATIQKGLRVEPDGSELNNAMGRELLRVGRSREGLVYLKRSMELDPLNPVKTAALIGPLAYYGDIDAAEVLAAKATALWPDNRMIWNAVFAMEARVGDASKAQAMLRDPLRPSQRSEDEVRRWQAMLRARLEPKAANLDAAAAEWTSYASREPDQDPMPVAETLAALGRTDLAYRLLASPTAPVDENADEIMFRSDMAAFRQDPRFMPLAGRRGLIAIWRSLGRWPDVCSEHPPPHGCRAGAR